MKKHADPSNPKRSQAERPLSYEEILLQENVPASERVPADLEQRLSKKSIVVKSDEKDFDPRKYFSKIKGSPGLWEFTTTESMLHGAPVERTGKFKPGSLPRGQHGRTGLEAFRPLWQPYVFHPKAVETQPAPPMLQRKCGDKVRPDIVFNRDDRELFYPQGFPWQCIGRLFVSSQNSGLASGTATLVGRRTVLTSSHLIPWGAPGLIVLFVPAYWNWPIPWTPLTPTVPPPLQMASIGTDVWGYQQGKRQAYDLALVRLREPLGDRLGYFGATVYDDDWEDERVGRWSGIRVSSTWLLGRPDSRAATTMATCLRDNSASRSRTTTRMTTHSNWNIVPTPRTEILVARCSGIGLMGHTSSGFSR